jgi:hypothetical protein
MWAATAEPASSAEPAAIVYGEHELLLLFRVYAALSPNTASTVYLLHDLVFADVHYKILCAAQTMS